jgi:hypothetical protein
MLTAGVSDNSGGFQRGNEPAKTFLDRLPCFRLLPWAWFHRPGQIIDIRPVRADEILPGQSQQWYHVSRTGRLSGRRDRPVGWYVRRQPSCRDCVAAHRRHDRWIELELDYEGQEADSPQETPSIHWRSFANMSSNARS